MVTYTDELAKEKERKKERKKKKKGFRRVIQRSGFVI
jgi:hypothetical protein